MAFLDIFGDSPYLKQLPSIFGILAKLAFAKNGRLMLLIKLDSIWQIW
jgi:hypothetical protein